MAKDIVLFCDNHPIDTEVRGRTRQIDVGDGRHEVELCDDCYAQLVAPMAKLLADFGRAVELGDGSRKKLHCPWCAQSLATPRSLRDHVDTKHAEHASAFVEGLVAPSPRRGRPPKTEKEPEESRGPNDCPECGKTCGSPQGLGRHRLSHGVVGSSPSTLYNRRRAQK